MKNFIAAIFPPRLPPDLETTRNTLLVPTMIPIVWGATIFWIIAVLTDVFGELPPNVLIVDLIIRFGFIVPTLFVLLFVLHRRKEFVVRHFDHVFMTLLFLNWIGLAVMTGPMYQSFVPQSGNFSFGRVAVLWASIVVVPLHFTNALLFGMGAIVVYIPMMYAIPSPFPLYYLAINVTSLLGPYISGAMASRNRDILEHDFFTSLASRSWAIDLQQTGRQSAVVRQREILEVYKATGGTWPEFPGDVQQPLAKEVNGEMGALGASPSLEEESAVLFRVFNRHITRSWGIFFKFNDQRVESTFRAQESFLRVNTVSVSLALAALFYGVLGSTEIITAHQLPALLPHLTLLLCLRYAVALPIMCAPTLGRLFGATDLIRTIGRLSACGVLFVHQMVQIARYVIVSTTVGFDIGEPELVSMNYLNNLYRGVVFITCALPILPHATFVTGGLAMLIGWGTVIVSGVIGNIRFVPIFGAFVYVGFSFFVGSYRSQIDTYRARVTFLMRYVHEENSKTAAPDPEIADELYV